MINSNLQTISNPSLYCFTHNGSPIKDISNKLVLTEDEISSRLVIIRGRPRLLGGKGGAKFSCHFNYSIFQLP